MSTVRPAAAGVSSGLFRSQAKKRKIKKGVHQKECISGNETKASGGIQ